jgi:PAS domain S-box-containing protein
LQHYFSQELENNMIEAHEVQNYLKKLTVLYIEDEELTREMFSEFLSRIVGVLITATNGSEGLTAYREHKPDVIITDIQMPFMDGLTMLQEIRSVDTNIPTIILSAFEEMSHLKRSIDLGVSGYVFKPVNVDKLLESLLKCARVLCMENTLNHSRVQLEESEQFMRKLTDIIPGMLGYWTRDLRCGFANAAYQEWFGKTPEQMHGIHILDLMGEELFRKNEPFITAALRGERKIFERTLTKADGSIGSTLAHYIPDLSGNQVLGFFVMVTDVTELKQGQNR